MKNILLTSLFIIFTTAIFSQQQEKIKKLIEKGDLEKAEKLCVEEKKDYFYDCYQEIADAYLHRGEVEKAEARYKMSNYYERGMEKIADMYYSKDDLVNAAASYEKAKQKTGFIKIADSYFRKGDLENAANYYKKGLSYYSLSKIANSYLEKNDLANAAINYEDAGDKSGVKKVADAYFKNNDYSNAAVCYEKAGDKLGIKNVANAYFEKGDYANAATFYEKLEDKFGIQAIAKAYASRKDYVNAKINYEKINYILDIRDGKAYKTIKIGNQWIMAENLAYKPAKGNCWAYYNDESNVKEYGYLYDWETAKTIAISGWHLPSAEEWKTLQKYLEGHGDPNKLLEALQGGTDFNAKGGGSRLEKGFFSGLEYVNELWSSTALDASFAYTFCINSFKRYAGISNLKKGSGLSVRLIKD